MRCCDCDDEEPVTTISASQWQKLAACLQQEPMILGYRNTAENLAELYRQGLTSGIVDGQGITAFVAFWPTDRAEFLEFGSIWVKPELRGHGLGHRVFSNLMLHQPPGKTVFAITKNPKVVHLMLAAGWQEATAQTWEEHVPWEVTCGPCDVPGDRHACACKGQRDQCGLYYKLG